MDIGCTPFFVHEFMYLGQHFREVGDDWKIFCYWLEDILLWLEDRLEDTPF